MCQTRRVGTRGCGHMCSQSESSPGSWKEKNIIEIQGIVVELATWSMAQGLSTWLQQFSGKSRV